MAAVLQQQIDDAAGVRRELEDELARLRVGEEEVRVQIALAQRDMATAKRDFEDWETAALRQQIADAAEVRRGLEAELESLRVSEANVRGAVADARRARDDANVALTEWDARARVATEAVIARQKDEVAMKTQLEDVERSVEETERAHAEASARRDALASELATLEAATDNYAAQLEATGKNQAAVSLALAERQKAAKVERERLTKEATTAETEAETAKTRAEEATARVIAAQEAERNMANQLQDTESNVAQMRAQVKRLTEESTSLASELDRLRGVVDIYNSQVASSTREEVEAKNMLEVKSEALTKAKQAADAEVSALTKALDEAKSKAEALQEELLREVQKANGAKIGLEDASVALRESEEGKAEAERRREEVEDALARTEDAIYAAEAQLEEATENEKYALDNLAERSKEDEGLAARIAEAEAALAEKRARLEEMVTAETAVELELKKAVERDGALKQAMVNMAEEIAEKERVLETAKAKGRAMDDELEAVVQMFAEKNHDLGRANAKVMTVKERLDEVKSLLADGNNRLLARGMKLDKCKEAQGEAEKKLKIAEEVLAKKIEDHTQVKAQLEEMDAEKASMLMESKERAVELEAIKRQLAKLEKDKGALLAQVEEVAGDVKAANNELAATQMDLQEAHGKLRRAQE